MGELLFFARRGTARSREAAVGNRKRRSSHQNGERRGDTGRAGGRDADRRSAGARESVRPGGSEAALPYQIGFRQAATAAPQSCSIQEEALRQSKTTRGWRENEVLRRRTSQVYNRIYGMYGAGGVGAE